MASPQKPPDPSSGAEAPPPQPTGGDESTQLDARYDALTTALNGLGEQFANLTKSVTDSIGEQRTWLGEQLATLKPSESQMEPPDTTSGGTPPQTPPEIQVQDSPPPVRRGTRTKVDLGRMFFGPRP